jgi:hypothetical protein
MKKGTTGLPGSPTNSDALAEHEVANDTSITGWFDTGT